MNRHPLQLDEPSGVSGRAAAAGVMLSALYLLTALLVARLPGDPVLAVPSVVLAHSLSMAIVGTVTAILLYAHAARASNVGYLILAGTFVTVVILVLALPLAFPGALLVSADGSPERVLGGVQSSISLFYAWHLVLYLGLPVSALVLFRATMRPRHPPAAWTVAGSIAVAVGVGLIGAGWALLAPDSLPAFIGEGAITAVAAATDWVLVGIAVVGLVVIVVVTRERNAISRWITAVAVLSLGEAIVNVGVERYSVGWYFTRTFGLLAMSCLLVALVWEMARVDRTTLMVASRDALTNARSRATFEEDLAREVDLCQASGELLALLWIDIDDFKGVNDRFGHQAGDEVLRVMVRRALTQIRSTDLLARMGGDEFAVAIPDAVSRDAAEAVAGRLLEQLSRPIDISGQLVYASCSIGVAYSPDDGTSAQVLSHHADVAMYEAKSQGGNRLVVFRPGLDEEARASAELRLALMAAVEARAFVPFAQPVVDVATGRIIGLELLARWQRGSQIAAAASFIQLANTSRLIAPIGRQVLVAAAELIPGVLAAHPDLEFVTVNLSASELGDARTMEMLQTSPWADLAAFVIVEVTESDAIDDDGAVPQSLESLRDRGYRLAVDNFGVGFSTIARLQQVQPCLIKADRSLLTHSQQPGPHPAAMLRWAFDISEALGSRLVVEGVETDSEEAAVRDLGPVLAQGYRYGVPVPLADWLTDPARVE